MQAFHNDHSIKEKYIQRVKEHSEADEIIKGTYWEDGKGCAVGCTIHSSDHSLYETELGIPMWLARAEDAIFEGLSNVKAKKWPLRFLNSIKIGDNLERIKIPFLIYAVESSLDKFDHSKSKLKDSIDKVIYILKNDPNNKEKLIKLGREAAVAYYDPYSSYDPCAAYAAYAAVSYSYYYADAVYSCASSSSYYYFRQKTFEDFSDKLIELIES